MKAWTDADKLEPNDNNRLKVSTILLVEFIEYRGQKFADNHQKRALKVEIVIPISYFG
jgi:hypothetical protein